MRALVTARMGRANFLFGILGLAIAWVAAQFALSGWLNLMLELGPKTRFEAFGTAPPLLLAAALALDIALFWFVARRLRDIGVPGWGALGLLLVPLFGSVGLILLIGGLIALVALPGQIGPNRFGPDPRGWTSRAQYDAQGERLRSGKL